jgi:hypothetical protein
MRSAVLGLVALAGAYAVLPGAADAEAAETMVLGAGQRIACVRGLSPGKLQTSSCRSYTYIFNSKTTEYFRCNAAVTVTKDNKDLMKIDTEGACQKRGRIFDKDGSYSFDAAETEGPNTNSFFGQGGYVIWASDNAKLAAKACFIIAVGGKDGEVQRCVDMKFD